MNSIEQAFDDLDKIKSYLYQFADSFAKCSVLDSNETPAALNEGKYEFLAGFGCRKQYSGTASVQLKEAETSGYWKFLSIEYGLISDENLPADIFEPELVIYILKNERKFRAVNNGISEEKFRYLLRTLRELKPEHAEKAPSTINFEAACSRSEYIQTVARIRNDIRNGKYYEMNYCIEFKSVQRSLPWLTHFLKLNDSSRAPFAAYVKNEDRVVLCSSPERFLLKAGKRLLSQPIKGTNKRLPGMDNLHQLELLKSSEKEMAENVMIVDLVRNDLARICESGTVKVDELCGAYAYTSVNHLVSSISGIKKDNIGIADIFEAMYPMGSMTGAPKIEVMKHIDLYEKGRRGMYSGCLGYMTPEGDMDLNVIIRSLVYGLSDGILSYKVGSAITYDSSEEAEYEECLLKGNRLSAAFGT